MRSDLEHARCERRRAEERLRHEHEHLTVPLHEIREQNHIGPLISALIQRKVSGSA